MEKPFYLNASNSKNLCIGIKPATKLYAQECVGFYVEAAIHGNMRPMNLGGLDGLLNLCQSLRGFEELSFAYPHCASNYAEIQTLQPLNISKRMVSGTLCFHIENVNGEAATVAQNSCSELLKFENLIVTSIKKLQNVVTDVEGKFNQLITNLSTDWTGTVKNVEKELDTFASDALTNFNELVRACVDETNRKAAVAAAAAAAAVPAATKKRKAPSTSNARRPKKVVKVMQVEEEEDDIEVVDNEEETAVADTPPATDHTPAASDHSYADTSDTTIPLGLIESGQRFDSEFYA